MTVATCVPYDPESKGGSEATVRIAKADLVPTEANLRPEYSSWNELVVACEEFIGEVNDRPHRATRRTPNEMLAEEAVHLHRLPEVAYTAVFGETRHVSWSATISFGGVQYSVPAHLGRLGGLGPIEGDELVVTHVAGRGATEVARHRLSTPGIPASTTPTIRPGHRARSSASPRPPTKPSGPSWRSARGPTCGWSKPERPAPSRIKVKMADAVSWPACTETKRSTSPSDRPPSMGASPKATWPPSSPLQPIGDHHSASENHSLQGGTAAWKGFGT